MPIEIESPVEGVLLSGAYDTIFDGLTTEKAFRKREELRMRTYRRTQSGFSHLTKKRLAIANLFRVL
jgi:hypothetical protein